MGAYACQITFKTLQKTVLKLSWLYFVDFANNLENLMNISCDCKHDGCGFDSHSKQWIILNIGIQQPKK